MSNPILFDYSVIRTAGDRESDVKEVVYLIGVGERHWLGPYLSDMYEHFGIGLQSPDSEVVRGEHQLVLLKSLLEKALSDSIVQPEHWTIPIGFRVDPRTYRPTQIPVLEEISRERLVRFLKSLISMIDTALAQDEQLVFAFGR